MQSAFILETVCPHTAVQRMPAATFFPRHYLHQSGQMWGPKGGPQKYGSRIKGGCVRQKWSAGRRLSARASEECSRGRGRMASQVGPTPHACAPWSQRQGLVPPVPAEEQHKSAFDLTAIGQAEGLFNWRTLMGQHTVDDMYRSAGRKNHAHAGTCFASLEYPDVNTIWARPY